MNIQQKLSNLAKLANACVDDKKIQEVLTSAENLAKQGRSSLYYWGHLMEAEIAQLEGEGLKVELVPDRNGSYNHYHIVSWKDTNDSKGSDTPSL